MKKKLVCSIISLITLCCLSLSVAGFTFNFKNGEKVAHAQSEGLPISGDILSTEDYYRLLYINQTERENDFVFDFEEEGFEVGDIESIENGMSLASGLNMGFLSLGFLSGKISKKTSSSLFANVGLVTSVLKFVNFKTSIYQINENTSQMIDQLSNELSEVYSALSYDLENQTKTLTNELTAKVTYLESVINATSYASDLKTFNTTAFGLDFSTNTYMGYGRWRSELFTKYQTLLQQKDTDNEQTAFDNLYLIAKKGIEVLPSYILSNEYSAGNDHSIQEILYWYSLIRWKNTGEDFEQALCSCLDFIEDLYNTYLFARICLNICYEYQLNVVGSNLAEDKEIEKQYYKSDKCEVYFGEEIFAFKQNASGEMSDPNEQNVKISAELSNFIAYALNLYETYYYNYNGVTEKVIYNTLSAKPSYKSVPLTTSAGEIANTYLSVRNTVKTNSTVYLNVLPKAFTEYFGANYTFKVDNGSLATVTNEGIVKVVGSSGTFTVNYLCNGLTVYSMPFVINNEESVPFSGMGLGVAESPFILTETSHLAYLANNPSYWTENYAFKLGSDILISNTTVGTIGSMANPFCGVFDGAGYTITGGSEYKPVNALFGENHGTIRNIIFTDARVDDSGILDCAHLYVGGIACINRGLIENCTVSNITASCEINDNVYEYVAGITGGICGYNSGTIINCKNVNGSAAPVDARNGVTNGGGSAISVSGYSGGIAGYSAGGTIENCLVTGNTAGVLIFSQSYYIAIGIFFKMYKTESYAYAGSFIGYAESTVVRNCVSYNNTNVAYVSHKTVQNENNIQEKENEDPVIVSKGTKTVSGYSNCTFENYYVDVCDNGVGTLISNISEENKTVMQNNGWVWGDTPTRKEITSVEVSQAPFKTLYYVGENFNFAGLTLKTDTNEYICENIEVSGFSSETIGTVTLTATWRGFQTTFTVTIACPHENISESVDSVTSTCVTTTTKKSYSCQDCEEQLNKLNCEERTVNASLHIYDDDCDEVCNYCLGEREVSHNYGSGTVISEATCLKDGEIKYVCANCGDVKTEKVEGGHKYEITVIKPTCVNKGRTDYNCLKCGYYEFDSVTSALGHNWDDGEETRAAGCETQGEITYTCLRCYGVRTESTLALGHNYSQSVTQPTCEQSGYTTHTCLKCGNVYADNYVNALDHQYTSKKVGATCTASGYTQYTCSRCNESYREDYTSALGHSVIDEVIDPDCLNRGYTLHYCSRCDYTKKDSYVPALGHNWLTERTVAPTCEQQGYTDYYCSDCEETKVGDYTSALGHNLITAPEKTPTCTETGYTKKVYCSVNGCDYVQTQSEVVPALGHGYKQTVVEPTCTEQGYTVNTCDKCKDSYNDNYVSAKGHESVIEDCEQGEMCNRCFALLAEPTNHVESEWITDVEATKKEEGHAFKKCVNCGKVLEEKTIEKTGCSGNFNGFESALYLLPVAVLAIFKKKFKRTKTAL